MANQRKILLIGDNHPEMLAIAENLARRKIDFTILLPVFFMDSEMEILKRLPKLSKHALKRQVPNQIQSRQVIRPLFILELIIWYSKQRGFNNSARVLTKISEQMYKFYLFIRIKISRPTLVITYDTFFVKKNNFKLIVICPAIHPNSHRKYIENAQKKAEGWPEKFHSLLSEAKIETINDADKLIVLSKFAAQSYLENGILEHLIEIIHIGPKNFLKGVNENNRRNERDGKKLEVIFLGRLTLSKGIKDILEASWKLSDQFSFSLVGNCSDELFEYLKSKSNSANLRIYRGADHKKISELIASANVMLHPSYFEGFSIACIEGLRNGLIPIFSTNSGVAEILRGSDFEKLIIHPGDIQSIVTKLEYVASLDGKKLNELSYWAKEISRDYSFENFSNSLVNYVLRIN